MFSGACRAGGEGCTLPQVQEVRHHNLVVRRAPTPFRIAFLDAASTSSTASFPATYLCCRATNKSCILIPWSRSPLSLLGKLVILNHSVVILNIKTRSRLVVLGFLVNLNSCALASHDGRSSSSSSRNGHYIQIIPSSLSVWLLGRNHPWSKLSGAQVFHFGTCDFQSSEHIHCRSTIPRCLLILYLCLLH